MSAPPPHTHISTGRTNSELNRVAPGSTSATSGATNTSVMAGKARFQTEATAPSAVDMSTPQQRTRPGSYSCRISEYSRIGEHLQRRQPRRLLHHCEVTSAVPALGRSTDPPGSSEETPRRPPTVYSVQGDGYRTPTVFPQLQNLWRAHFVAALSCSGLRELAPSLSSLDIIVVLPHLFPVLPDPGSGNAPLPMLLTPHVRSRQDGADLPTVTRD